MTSLRLASFLLLAVTAGCERAPAPAGTGDDGTYSRIVTLAPSLAELVFAAGAGDALVGVSAYSVYPPAARELPVVGDAFTVDQERLALLEPDLLLAWRSGTPEHVADELRQSGYNVVSIRTQTLADIADAVERIGDLTGTEERAGEVAAEFEAGLRALAARYGQAGTVTVFYQVSNRPLYTVGGEHYISELIAVCGGDNVFADVTEIAPAIDVEAVVDRDPDVLLAGWDAGKDAFAEWERWPAMTANRLDNRFRLPDELGRPTPGLLAAAGELCRVLDVARERRSRSGGAPSVNSS